jgi:hypothetical protein
MRFVLSKLKGCQAEITSTILGYYKKEREGVTWGGGGKEIKRDIFLILSL